MSDQIRLDISVADLRKELAALKTELDAVRQSGAQAFGAVGDGAKRAATVGEQAASGLADAIREDVRAAEELKSKYNELSKAAGAAQKGGFGKESSTNLKEAAKSAGGLKDQLKEAAGGAIEAVGATDKLTAAQRIFNAVAKANPLGLILTALAAIIGSVIAYFSRFQAGMDKVSQITAAAGAVLNVLIDRVATLGRAFVNFATGNFSAGMDDLKASVTGLGSELVATASKAAALEAELQKLQDAQIANITAFAARENQVEKLKLISEDETASIGARVKALRGAASEESKLYADRIAQGEAFLENLKKRNALDSVNRAEAEEQARAEAELINLRGEADRSRIENENKIRELRKQGYEQARRESEALQKDLDKIAETIQKLFVATQEDGLDKDLAAVNKKYDDLQEAAADGIAKLNEIEKKGRGLTPEQQQQLQQLTEFQVKLEEKRLSDLVDVLDKYNEAEAQLAEEQVARRKALADKEQAEAIKSLETYRDAQNRKLDIQEQVDKAVILQLEKSGASKQQVQAAEERLDLLRQRQRLENELAFQLALTDTLRDGEDDRLQAILDSVDKIRKQIANIDTQLGAASSSKGGKKFSLWTILGLDEDKDKEVISKLKDGIGEVVNALGDLTAARIAAAEAAVKAAEDQVSAAEDALDREIELAKLGYANNVDLRRKELDDAKTARDRALSEQKRAQKAQLAIDTAVQASNIVTSATNIFKEGTKFWPVGFLLAIASVASLISLISGVRARAKALSQPTQFKHGGEATVTRDSILVGPSHDGGGIGIEAEGGEFTTTDGRRLAIVNKRMTKKHFDLIRAINNDDRPAMARHLDRLTGGIRINRSATDQHAQPSSSVDAKDKRIEQLLEENNMLLKRQIEIEETRPTVVDAGDFIEIRYKHRTERIRKNG